MSNIGNTSNVVGANLAQCHYLDLVNIIVLILDSKGRIKEINTFGLKLLGYEKEELLGKVWWDTCVPERHRDEVEEVFLASDGDGARFRDHDNPVLTKSGEERLIRWHNAVVRDEQGDFCEGFATGEDITEQTNMLMKLQQLSVAVEQSPASIVITDIEGKIEYVNNKFCQLTGYSLEEAIGNNPRILKSGETDPDVYKQLWATITAGETWQGELHNKKKSGELYWENASISAVKDETGKIINYLAVKEDITEHKLEEAKLAEASRELERQIQQSNQKNAELEQTKSTLLQVLEEERELERQLKQEKERVEEKVKQRTQELADQQAKLKASIDSLPVGYLMSDQSGKAVLTNKAMQTLMETDKLEEMQGIVRQWVNSAEHGELDDVSGLPRQAIMVGGIQYKSHYVDLSVVPIDSGDRGQLIGWVVLVVDITEAKMLEKSRDDFFSIASHELRTPLTTIRGNTALILDYFPEAMKDTSLKQSVDDIHTSAVRLIQIVNDFLYASRLEMNKVIYATEWFDILPVIYQVTKSLSQSIDSSAVQLVVETGQYPEYWVRADRVRVEQILVNVIGNAIKYTSRGEIRVDVSQTDNMFNVWIKDSGEGIALEKQHLLFKKFQQASENVYTRTSSQGSGMGLYISRLLARGMGGDIRLEWSELDKGSVFVLELPL